jgi:hypothetical protein
VKQIAKGPRFTEKSFVGLEKLSDTPGPGRYETAEPIEIEVGKAKTGKKGGLGGRGPLPLSWSLAFMEMEEKRKPPKTKLVKFGVGGFIGLAPKLKPKKVKMPGPASYQDGSKCEILKPSASKLFDPAQQKSTKYDV